MWLTLGTREILVNTFATSQFPDHIQRFVYWLTTVEARAIMDAIKMSMARLAGSICTVL